MVAGHLGHTEDGLQALAEAHTLADGATIALAVNTEKAKSEFIIAPILLEVRRVCRGAVGVLTYIVQNA